MDENEPTDRDEAVRVEMTKLERLAIRSEELKIEIARVLEERDAALAAIKKLVESP